MTRASWKRKIKKACVAAGTYQPFFDVTIDALAGILATKDEAERQFNESGAQAVVKYTNKSGIENTVKNPSLVVIMDCNAQALAFWRDLGLTPAGLKRIGEHAGPQKTEDENKTVLDTIRSKHRK